MSAELESRGVLQPLAGAFTGNYWTLVSHAQRSGARAPVAERIERVVEDPQVGPVRIGASLSVPAGARRLLVLIHGLGGSSESGYVRRGASVAHRLGLAALRVDMRGAAGDGEDYYHAGLGQDVEALLQHPACAAFDQVMVLGYSLGGHIALAHALKCSHPRQVALATLCSPLDLQQSQRGFDERMPWVYRHHVLRSLKAMYRTVAAHRPVPCPLETVLGIAKIYDWDRQVVAPRHGYDSAESYYRATSVRPRLSELKLPALIVRGDRDPMVFAESSQPSADARCRVFVARGGHVGFAPGFDLGFEGEKSADEQIQRWLIAQADAAY